MKKVIIIEDSPTFCNMLGKKLEAKGWKTILCYNYRDGLKAVKESSEWDVVISDMRLGNDNGIDLLEWMRSNGYKNPFIIMTSYDESMSAVRTMKLGAEDYIPKKLLLDVVYERLEEIIDKQKRLVELNITMDMYLDHTMSLEANGMCTLVSHELDVNGDLSLRFAITDDGRTTVEKYVPAKSRSR